MPRTLMMPSALLTEIRKYLDSRPYGEVAGLVGAMENCARLQMTNGPVAVSRGECPEVATAMAEARKTETSRPSLEAIRPEVKQ